MFAGVKRKERELIEIKSVCDNIDGESNQITNEPGRTLEGKKKETGFRSLAFNPFAVPLMLFTKGLISLQRSKADLISASRPLSLNHLFASSSSQYEPNEPLIQS